MKKERETRERESIDQPNFMYTHSAFPPSNLVIFYRLYHEWSVSTTNMLEVTWVPLHIRESQGVLGPSLNYIEQKRANANLYVSSQHHLRHAAANVEPTRVVLENNVYWISWSQKKQLLLNSMSFPCMSPCLGGASTCSPFSLLSFVSFHLCYTTE